MVILITQAKLHLRVQNPSWPTHRYILAPYYIDQYWTLSKNQNIELHKKPAKALGRQSI